MTGFFVTFLLMRITRRDDLSHHGLHTIHFFKDINYGAFMNAVARTFAHRLQTDSVKAACLACASVKPPGLFR